MTQSTILYLGKLPPEYRERFSLYCEGVECARIEGSGSEGVVFFQSEYEEEKELWEKKANVGFMNSIILDWIEESMQEIRRHEVIET